MHQMRIKRKMRKNKPMRICSESASDASSGREPRLGKRKPVEQARHDGGDEEEHGAEEEEVKADE